MKLPPYKARVAAAAFVTSAASVASNNFASRSGSSTSITAAAAAVKSMSSSYQSRISSIAAEIKPRVLKSSRGSGNYGESGSAAFYTLDALPSVLENEQPSCSATDAAELGTLPPLKRVDLDLGPDRLAFYIDNVLTADEADALAACAEAVLEHNGHSRLAPGIMTPPGMRINEAAHWYPPYNSNFLTRIFQRVRPLVPETIDHYGDSLPLYEGFSEKVAQFKYSKSDKFNRHVDGLFPGQGINPQSDGIDEWTGVVSGFSMLFYCNDFAKDGLMGGETRVWSADGKRHIDIQPRKGRVLVFRRGSHDAVLHAGLEVTGEVPKYMALINVAYGEKSGTQPMRA